MDKEELRIMAIEICKGLLRNGVICFEKGYEEGKSEALKEVEKLIDFERIYPDYRGLSVEEALTQFKIRIKSKLTKAGK